jgi:hypothetical protein
MTDFDTNVGNYTLSELLTIAGIENDDINEEAIMTRTDKLIKQFKVKNPRLSVFFKGVQSQLLQYEQGLNAHSDNDDIGDYDDDETIRVEPRGGSVEGFGNMSNEAVYPKGDKQINEWYKNENLTQTDQNQTNKITQRKQKVGVFGNQHAPMKREQIATTDTFSLPVKQDSLNPNLKNTINRFVNIDSQFRQYTNGIDSTSTDYTLDLSDTLKNTLKLSLYSYQIPFSWYTIDTAYGNTCLWILDDIGNAVPVSVPSGNYTQIEFKDQLTKSFLDAGFTFPLTDPSNTPVGYNPNSGIITLNLYNGAYNPAPPIPPATVPPPFLISESTRVLFYDFTGELQCKQTCRSNTNHFFNNTLGWLMGYRLPYINVDPSGNKATAILDLNGVKYLILVIDDYNQNHVNNSLVSISQYSNVLKMPPYYSPDLPSTCIRPIPQQGGNLQELVAEETFLYVSESRPPNGLLIAGKYENDYTPTQVVLPSAPRTLTQAQLYTINEINRQNNNLTKYLATAPTTSDILAIIPIKTSSGVPTGSLLVEYSGSLQDSSRVYFGPVNIERMAVKLLDDKGNVLNLNGSDWCFTLVSECLYQY